MEIHTGILMLIIGVGMADFTILTFTEIHGVMIGISEIIPMVEETQIMHMAEEIQTEILETTP